MSDYIMFSNDGPLGAISGPVNQEPSAAYAQWDDRNYLGSAAPTTYHVSGFRILCGSPEAQAILMALVAVVLLARFTARDFDKAWRCIYAGICLVNIIAIILLAIGIATGAVDPYGDSPAMCIPSLTVYVIIGLLILLPTVVEE